MSEQKNPEIPKTPDDDEISLVDLLAVLIRYRRMIVGGTLAVLGLAAVWFYALPAAGLTASEAATDAKPVTWTARLELELPLIPEDLEPYVTVDPAARARLLLDEHERNGGEISSSYNADTRILTVEAGGASEAQALSTLTAAVDTAERGLAQRLDRDLVEAERRITRRVESASTRLGEIVDDAAGDESDRTTPPPGSAGLTAEQILRYLALSISMENAVQAFREDADLLEQIRYVRSQPCTLCPILEEPVITMEEPENGGRGVRVVVTTVAALFLLIFIAFVRQYAATVKADPEESRKLREAWHRR